MSRATRASGAYVGPRAPCPVRRALSLLTQRKRRRGRGARFARRDRSCRKPGFGWVEGKQRRISNRRGGGLVTRGVRAGRVGAKLLVCRQPASSRKRGRRRQHAAQGTGRKAGATTPRAKREAPEARKRSGPWLGSTRLVTAGSLLRDPQGPWGGQQRRRHLDPAVDVVDGASTPSVQRELGGPRRRDRPGMGWFVVVLVGCLDCRSRRGNPAVEGVLAPACGRL
jgi:hypothetical protein